MGNIKFCSILIKDDFNNILISKRKGKKADEHLWYLFDRKIKGRETPEKCANRAIKEDLKTIVFDLKELYDFNINEEESLRVFTGSLKEKVTCGANITAYKWINKDELSNYTFADGELEKINAFFETI
ncbi:NUDIX domain-containing protein [Clostridium sp. LIBA-8841]|uniref:NUDIX domain-containing protein n=1 Tax=Clostridium sp. LIBA-8841 TaxID=2987530 RepID=UPI002AC65F07|nr:NUDIX domain-containing protein [Clostridium sp. LIBA-8841]MDZ5253264.1 NUDIX domain-containing protein [Clostridium sp. LIBA-8841]